MAYVTLFAVDFLNTLGYIYVVGPRVGFGKAMMILSWIDFIGYMYDDDLGISHNGVDTATFTNIHGDIYVCHKEDCDDFTVKFQAMFGSWGHWYARCSDERALDLSKMTMIAGRTVK